MNSLLRLLTVSILVVALAPAAPAVAGGDGKAEKQHTTKVKKKKAKKKAAKKRAVSTRTDAATTVTDPGTTVTDPGTTVSDPGTTVTDPGTTVPSPAATGNPAKQCKAEQAEMGAAEFAKKYGTNKNLANAFGKCVSAHAHAKK